MRVILVAVNGAMVVRHCFACSCRCRGDRCAQPGQAPAADGRAIMIAVQNEHDWAKLCADERFASNSRLEEG
jgi:crotonobetainyl-CoA:carnitine CoA-transferase CaiB-like acyl-CoA transferase